MNTFPSLSNQVKNLSKFTFEVVKNTVSISPPESVFLSSEEERKRFDICLSCQYYENGRCSQCGCFMKVKVKFSTSKCPVGLW